MYVVWYSENKCDIKNQVIFEEGKVKLSTIDEIKAEARKAVNMVKAERLRAQLNARVETLRRFNNYSSVLKIVDEIDEEMKVEEAMRREQEAANKLPQAKENAMFAPLSPIIDLTSYMSPGQKKPEDVSGPEEDSDSIGDTSSITSVVFELKSPVKCTITSPLPPARVSPKTNLRSASFSAAATSNAMGLIGLKSPPNARANTRATILSPPGSASKRRGSHMRESVVDDRTKQMATMRMQAEELHRQALINKLMAKEAKLMKNEKQKEMVGMLKQLSMVVMLLSRVGCMHRLIVERRAAMAHQIAQQKLLRSVVWVQRWWYFVKIKLCMKRNPLSVEKIRMVVLCGIRIRRLKKRHQGIALMKEFLFSSVILKDMVAKIYGYRRKAIRVSK